MTTIPVSFFVLKSNSAYALAPQPLASSITTWPTPMYVPGTDDGSAMPSTPFPLGAEKSNGSVVVPSPEWVEFCSVSTTKPPFQTTKWSGFVPETAFVTSPA